jgi:hypothetical protein
MFFSKTIVVLQMIPLVFERVEGFMVSRPEEFHPRPLSERCGSLSTHTAPIKQTRRSSLAASARITAAASSQYIPDPIFLDTDFK